MSRPNFSAAVALAGLLLGHAPAVTAQPVVEYVQPESTVIAEQVVLNGTVRSPLDAALSPEVAGLVATVAVDIGDDVAAGDVLLTLDATLAQLARDSAAAALREARAGLADARRLRDEAEPLAEQGNFPRSELATRVAAVQSATASVARLEAVLAEQAERVKRHVLKAPFAGTIRVRRVAPGAWVTPGTAVLGLVGQDAVRVEVQAPQRLYPKLQVGTPAFISLDALSTEALPGRIAGRVAALDAATRSFSLRVRPDTPSGTLVPGMSARVRFDLPGDARAVSVPRDAVLRFPDGSSIVWVVDEQDQARRRPVQLGPKRDALIVVTAGLEPADRVIVRGNERLKDADVVRPRAYQP